MLGGFRFSETMSGTWTRVGAAPGDERPIEFQVTARARSWLKHLRDHKASLDGIVRMEGFAQGAPLVGELVINPVLGRIIKYDFQFTADDGKPYRFRGQKDVSVLDLVGTMTTLPAEIYDSSERKVATCLLKFDTRGLPRFLASFRPGA